MDRHVGARGGADDLRRSATLFVFVALLSGLAVLPGCDRGSAAPAAGSTPSPATVERARPPSPLGPTPQPTVNPPTPGLIAYIGTDGNVWTISGDGVNETRLTSGGRASSPRWSPDGRFVAYIEGIYDQARIGGEVVIMAADGSQPHTVFSFTRQQGRYNAPTTLKTVDWLSGSTLLVDLQLVRGGSGDHSCVISLNSPELLYEQECSVIVRDVKSSLAVSNSGAIAFTAWDIDQKAPVGFGARVNVAIVLKRGIDAPATRLVPLPDLPYDAVVAPSEDGRQVAYAVDGQIRVVNADGSGDRLVSSGGAPGGLAWSPRGDSIVFSTRTRTSPGDLLILSIEANQAPRKIAEGGDPDWAVVKSDLAAAVPPTATTARFFDAYSAALDWYVRNQGIDPARVGCAPDETCISEVGKWSGVAEYAAGCFQCEYGSPLFLGQQSDGTWEAVHYHEIGHPLFPPVPGTRAVVQGTGSCLNIRTTPSLSANSATCLADGAPIHIDGGLSFSDGFIWAHVSVPGWAVINYLAGCDPGPGPASRPFPCPP